MGLIYLSSQTASSSSSLSFTSGIDSTYDAYEFHFVNMHPASQGAHFAFQTNASGGSGFNEPITSTFFYAAELEDDSYQLFLYDSSYDQAQGTSFQYLAKSQPNANDAALSGVLTLYAPSSTTYVKHFSARTQSMQSTTPNYAMDIYAAGYINTTSAIDEIDFRFSSGNIDEGTIHMYGVK